MYDEAADLLHRSGPPGKVSSSHEAPGQVVRLPAV
jgi:hypothetical protein